MIRNENIKIIRMPKQFTKDVAYVNATQRFGDMIAEMAQKRGMTRWEFKTHIKKIINRNFHFRVYKISLKDFSRLERPDKCYVTMFSIQIIKKLWEIDPDTAEKYETLLIGYIDCVIGKTHQMVELYNDYNWENGGDDIRHINIRREIARNILTEANLLMEEINNAN